MNDQFSLSCSGGELPPPPALPPPPPPQSLEFRESRRIHDTSSDFRNGLCESQFKKKYPDSGGLDHRVVPPVPPPPVPPPASPKSHDHLKKIAATATNVDSSVTTGVVEVKNANLSPHPVPRTLSNVSCHSQPRILLSEESWPSLQKGRTPKKADMMKCAARTNMTSPMKAIECPQDEWKTGDFQVITAWSSCECWGDEVALSVEEGDLVTIDLVDTQGWARAVITAAKHSWLPYGVLRRIVHIVTRRFDERTYSDYVILKPNDRVVVYQYDQCDDRARLWCYGGRLKADNSQNVVEQVGWFPAEVIGQPASQHRQ